MTPRPNWKKKRDANEPDIVKALRRIGAKVELLDLFDLLVLFRGQVYLLEVKAPDGPKGGKIGRLTETQERLIREGWPLQTVKNVPEALAAIGAQRRES